MDTKPSEEDQLATINGALANADSIKPDLPAMQAMEADIKQRKVIINPYTPISCDDIASQWENYTQVEQLVYCHLSLHHCSKA